MITSTIQCPTCRAIFIARVAVKHVSQYRAKAQRKAIVALRDATEALIKVHAMPSEPDVVMAEVRLVMAVREATTTMLMRAFAPLTPSDFDAKMDEVIAEANAAYAAKLSRMQESHPSSEPAAKVLRFPQKGGDA